MASEPESPPPWRDRPALIAAAICVVAWLCVFGPTLPTLATHFVGTEYVDHYGTQWFYWFTQSALLGGITPDRADVFFYPYGKDVFADTGTNVLDGILAIPFRVLLGDVLGYNVFVLLGVVAAAVAFGAFVHEILRDRVAAIFGATLFGLCPYVLVELEEGRPTQALLLAPVLFVWMTWRSGTRQGWLAPVAAGFLLAICGYQYWYYAFFGGVACLFHGLWRTAFPVPEAGGRVRILARHALIAAVALICTVPFAWKLAIGGGDHAVTGLLDMTKWDLYANPPITVEGFTVSLFSWQPFRDDVGNLVVDYAERERFLSRMTAFPFTSVPLVLLWLWRPGRLDRGPIIAMMVGVALIAMGPTILVGNYVLPNLVYLALTESLPFLQRLWWAGRALGFGSVVAGLAFAAGIATVQRYGTRWQLALRTVALLGWGWTEYDDDLVPSDSWDGTIPAGYQCLATGPEGAILEVPFGWTQAHLYYQIAHHRPIFGGMLENNLTFTPDGTRELMKNNTWVIAVNKTSMRSQPPDWTEEDKQAMRDLGYRYIVVQKDAFAVEEKRETLHDNVARVELKRWLRRMEKVAGRPVYDDARIAIYAPWGDPAPCDVQHWKMDTVARGNTEVLSVSGLRNQEDQILTRIFAGGPRSATDTDTDSQ